MIGENPRVSVLIPAFNSAETFDACLRSVQLQSLADWECVNQRGRSFRYPQVQLEGWLKGEALFALDKLYEERMLEDFDREVPFAEGSRRKIDLTVGIEGFRHWVEMKYWFVGRQKGERYGPAFYAASTTTTSPSEDASTMRAVHLATGDFASARGEPMMRSQTSPTRSLPVFAGK